MGAGLQGGERGEDGSSRDSSVCVFAGAAAHTIAQGCKQLAPPLADVAATPEVIFGIVFMDTEQVPP